MSTSSSHSTCVLAVRSRIATVSHASCSFVHPSRVSLSLSSVHAQLILGDQSLSPSAEYNGCTCVSVGPFALDHQFVLFSPLDRVFEFSYATSPDDDDTVAAARQASQSASQLFTKHGMNLCVHVGHHHSHTVFLHASICLTLLMSFSLDSQQPTHSLDVSLLAHLTSILHQALLLVR